MGNRERGISLSWTGLGRLQDMTLELSLTGCKGCHADTADGDWWLGCGREGIGMTGNQGVLWEGEHPHAQTGDHRPWGPGTSCRCWVPIVLRKCFQRWRTKTWRTGEANLSSWPCCQSMAAFSFALKSSPLHWAFLHPGTVFLPSRDSPMIPVMRGLGSRFWQWTVKLYLFFLF